MDNKQQIRRRYIEIGMHILAWVLIFNMPLLTLRNDEQFTWTHYLQSLVFPFFFAVVFYVNYFYLIPGFFFSRRFLIFFFSNLMLYATCTFLMETSMASRKPPMRIGKNFNAPSPDKPLRRRGGPPPGVIAMSVVAFAMTTGVAVATLTTTRWFQSEDLRKDLEREHLKSELANLKNQLNPHFFFNTLNNIYSLIIQNQEKAQDAVHQLSKLMRYLLYDSNEKYVPLNKEIEFMHHYIDLMKLRVTENVSVSYSFPKETWGHSIAPLLFISLIENSFKHGISMSKPSTIEMLLTVSLEKELTFDIRNTSFPKTDSDRSGSGIGLENLRKRLSLLYPYKHSLEIKEDALFYQTILKVQL